MGMYTEIVVSTRLKSLPPLVFDALNAMCGKGSLDEDQEKRLAEQHALFNRPFLEDTDEAMIGYSRYEEDTHPTIYYANGVKRVPSDDGSTSEKVSYTK